MPIYEYRCSSCGHELEALQRLSDARLTTCPSCGAEALVKKVSAAGFQLKGSGWYATDFKQSGAKPPAKQDGEGKSERESAPASPDNGGSKGEGKSDAKSEAKADAKTETSTKSESKSETKSETSVPAKGTGVPPAST
jgi:putative FmdB family regulatory protein